MTVKEIRAAVRETRREMRESGIRRRSCFNGGHSPESYRLNAKMFSLETQLKAATAETAAADRGELTREVECLRNAERECHARAATAWTPAEADRWRRMAAWNASRREAREAGLAAA